MSKNVWEHKGNTGTSKTEVTVRSCCRKQFEEKKRTLPKALNLSDCHERIRRQIQPSYKKRVCIVGFLAVGKFKKKIRHLYSTLSSCSKRFTTLCRGICQTAYLDANCSHAVHNLIRENTRIHRCPQNRISDKPSHWRCCPLLFSNGVGVL